LGVEFDRKSLTLQSPLIFEFSRHFDDVRLYYFGILYVLLLKRHSCFNHIVEIERRTTVGTSILILYLLNRFLFLMNFAPCGFVRYRDAITCYTIKDKYCVRCRIWRDKLDIGILDRIWHLSLYKTNANLKYRNTEIKIGLFIIDF